MKKIFIVMFICLIIVICFVAVFFVVFPKKYMGYIIQYSDQYGLEKHLVASVINIESSYNPRAVSSAGAIGLMQLLPSTAHDVADRMNIMINDEDLFNVETNIKIGCYYLSYLMKIFDDNIENTLCAYNWGLTNVKNWINEGNVDEFGTITNIPVKETNDYIKKYNINSFVYKNIYKV